MGDYVKRVIDMLPKLSEDEVRRVLVSVVNENTMLESIIESLPAGLIIVDKKWNILQRNKAAIRFLFSSVMEEQKTESVPLWELISEPEIADFLKKAASSGKTNISEEFTSSGTDGSVRFLKVSILSFVQKEEICGNIVRVEDITSERSQAVLLRRMENLAGLTNLAAGMAHEIKNPLGAISIHVQLVQKAVQKKRQNGGTLPEKKFLEDHLEIVNGEIKKLNDLVMDFLFAVRPVNAQLTLSHPNLVLSNIANVFRAEFEEEDILLKENLCSEDVRVLIDEKLFRQVIVNIVQNAKGAIKQKDEEQKFNGTLEISSFVKDDKFCIFIKDNGIGMSRETCSRVFEPYFTTKANGTGLGMTMAYKIIKEFNGEIQVDSELGKGTVFSIFIPIPQTETKLLG